MSEQNADLPNNRFEHPEGVTLCVGKIMDFIDEMRRCECVDAMLTVTTEAPVRLTFAPSDAVLVLASARIGKDAYLYQAAAVRNDAGRELGGLDMLAQPGEVRELAEAQLEVTRRALAEGGLNVREGMWSKK